VSYKELVEAIQPINPETSASKSLRESGEIKIQDQGSPTRTSPLKTSGQKQIFGETNRSQGLQRSPIQTFSARSGSQKDKTSPLRSEIRSPQQGSDKKSIRSTMKKSFIGELRREGTLRDRDSDRLEGLLRVLKEIVVLEREVETAKEDLALRSDFNLFDAFRIFDRKGTGTVSAGQIEQGLNELGIFPSKDQLFLFVRKFDKDADAILK